MSTVAGYTGGFPLIIVLFILLVNVGLVGKVLDIVRTIHLDMDTVDSDTKVIG